MGSKVLAYDLGTSGVKASIYDQDGKSLAACFKAYPTSYPKSGYHEQNPLDWWASVVEATQTLTENNPAVKKDIVCAAVSGHSLGIVPIDQEGHLLLEAVPIWSDSRAGAEAESFAEKMSMDAWYLTTGNGFPPALYAIFKIMWMKNHLEAIYERTDKFLGTKDYINFRLTGKRCTDYSYASGSGVYNLTAWAYEKDYIELAGVDPGKLPDILPSTAMIGTILPEVAEALGLGEHVQVACGGVDNACMALGAGCVGDGMAYTSVGSSAWIAVSGHAPIVDVENKPYVFTHGIPDMFVSSAAIFSAGTSFRWLRDTVCKTLLTSEEPYDAMTALAAQSPVGANNLIFNPSLAGGSSLDKSPHIKGGFAGLTLGHTQNDLIRSVMEGICLNLKVALEVMETYTTLSDDMLIVGGGGKSQFWRQMFADVYGKNILETNIGQDAGSLGAAALAAVGVGLWPTFQFVKDLHQLKSQMAPNPENHQAYQKLLDLFKRIAVVFADIGVWIEKS